MPTLAIDHWNTDHRADVRAWEDSCLEFFFCPIPGDSRYFNY